MNILIDKLILFILCTAFYITTAQNNQKIVPILIVVTISAAWSYIEKAAWRFAGIFLFILLSFYNPVFIFYIPVLFYDLIFYRIKWIWVFLWIPLMMNYKQESLITNILIISFIVMAVLLKYRSLSVQKIKTQYFELQDHSKEMALILEIKNKELMEKQDYEINLATLNERNRIARDIHDNVGHMLSSSILQIGAMLATSNDEKSKERLRLINGTLSQAMDSIRSSVHDLHEESIDLNSEIKTLIDHFTLCPVEYSSDMRTNPEKKLKYCIISVIKEALSNIIKHSNATRVTITLREHPALYQLVIQDNGTKINKESTGGIGLKNISDRVAAFHGNLNISTEKGFRIFISIPKM